MIDILYVKIRLPNDQFLLTSTERAITLDVLQQIGAITELSTQERHELAQSCLSTALKHRAKLMREINSKVM